MIIKKIILGVICVLMMVSCGDNNVNNDANNDDINSANNAESKLTQALDSAKNPAKRFNYAILNNADRFYLLEGRVDDKDVEIYLTIKKNIDLLPDSSVFAQITGFYIVNHKSYLLESSLSNTQNEITLNILKDPDSRALLGTLSGYILSDGSFVASSIDNAPNQDILTSKATQAIFTPANNKINEITIVNASITKEHKKTNKKDKFFYSASKQAAKIPHISTKGIEKINNFFDANKQKMQAELLSDYQNNKNEYNYENIDDLEVRYIDEKILVFNRRIYIYSGGAHGSYDDIMVAFDTTSGERLPSDLSFLLEDVDNKNLKHLIFPELKKYDIFEQTTEDTLPLSQFIIEPDGIKFYWQLYEIAPYSSGIVEVKLDFDKVAPFVREDSPYKYLFVAK